MKKLLVSVLALLVVVSFSGVAAAAPAVKDPKPAVVSMTASPLTVYTDEEVVLGATALKQGSDYTDGYTVSGGNILSASTVLNTATGYYESTAKFKSATPGTYSVNYSITMTAGKSGVSFAGSASSTITVISRVVTIKGVALKGDWSWERSYTGGKNPVINGFTGTNIVVVSWSNGTSTEQPIRVHFGTGNGEPLTKDAEVIVQENGVGRVFKFPATRPVE